MKFLDKLKKLFFPKKMKALEEEKEQQLLQKAVMMRERASDINSNQIENAVPVELGVKNNARDRKSVV